MISHDASVVVERVRIADIRVTMCERREIAKVAKFASLLSLWPEHDHSLLVVAPDTLHPGLYVLQDGHHRFCAHIIAGRADALCVVVTEREEVDASLFDE